MDLRETKIIIKNEEHFEAVKARLKYLSIWSFMDRFCFHSKDMKIYINERLRTEWDLPENDNYPHYKTITIDDLFSVEKEKGVIVKFVLRSVCTGEVLHTKESYNDCVEILKSLPDGKYNIEKYFEVV